MSSKYWEVVATTPDVSLFVNKHRVDSYKLVEVNEIPLLCSPTTYLCKGDVHCSCFLKHYYFFSKFENNYKATVYTFRFFLKREHKIFPLKKVCDNTRYAVHYFPRQITEEEYK